jgi:hypothetical protein
MAHGAACQANAKERQNGGPPKAPDHSGKEYKEGKHARLLQWQGLQLEGLLPARASGEPVQGLQIDNRQYTISNTQQPIDNRQ